MASKIASGLVHASRWLRRRLEHIERRLQVQDQVLSCGWAAPQASNSINSYAGLPSFNAVNYAGAKVDLDRPVHSAVGQNPVKVDEGRAAVGQGWNSMKEGGQAAMSPWFHPDGRFYNPWK